MSKRASEQRDDITAWFASMPGLIFSGIVLGGGALWFIGTIVVTLIKQGL
jgi:hypothetical protein